MPTVHIIGAGISGLAAATALAEKRIPVKLYEASAHAGGRCRSSRDAKLGTMDHGLHLTSTADVEWQRYLTRIGAGDAGKRVASISLPAAPLIDYLPLLKGLIRPRGTLDASLDHDSLLRDAWLRPVARLMFGTHAARLPARAIRQLIRRRTMRMASGSLQASYIQPALDFLDQYGGSVYFSHALNRIERSGDTLHALTFARKKIDLMDDDMVILAAPPVFVQTVLPDLVLPVQEHSAITLHFQCVHREAPESVAYPLDAPMDVLRYRDGVISASIRLADGCWHNDQAWLARRIWKSIQQRHYYLHAMKMPDYAMWREKRAGHGVSDAPSVPHDHGTLLLAGDWLDPSRPATLEQAAASGHRAAALVMERLPKAPPRQSAPLF